jgi:hypothetical protein
MRGMRGFGGSCLAPLSLGRARGEQEGWGFAMLAAVWER